MLDIASLDRILNSMKDVRIAVVGDLFLDRYFDLDSKLTERSLETGLDAYQVSRVRCYPGAGGTVLNNLAALGVGHLSAVSVIGNDGEAFELMCALDRMGVDTEHVVQADDRMTPTYSKPMLSQPDGTFKELNRLDIRNRTPQSDELDRVVMRNLEKVIPEVQAIIVADQVSERNLGVVTDQVRNHLSKLAADNPGKLFFADSRSHIGDFRNCIVKPNQNELCLAVGANDDGEQMGKQSHLAAVLELTKKTGRPVYTTRGPNGIVYMENGEPQTVPGLKVPGDIDICGAGDSTTAGIVSALCTGAPPAQAAHLGCLVASITIQQIGVTGTAAPEQIRQRLSDQLAGKF